MGMDRHFAFSQPVRWLVIGAVAAGLATAAAAEQYRVDEMDDRARLQHRTWVQTRAVRDPAEYAANKDRVDEFFEKYYFPAMTRTDAAGLGELGKLRHELFTRYIWATNNEEMQRDLTRMAFAAARRMFAPDYHPAVRYNAVLIIGLLDEQYATARGTSPRPLPAANEYLVRMLKAANDGNPHITPPLVVGALVGLERHAQYSEGLSADAIAQMTTEVLRIADREEPMPDLNQEVFRWIQVQAARTLAKLGTPGPNGTIHQTLVKLIADEELGIDHRCAVAGLLAEIDYDGADIDGQAVAESLLSLARDLGADEARRVREFTELRIGPTRTTGRSPYGGELGGIGRGYPGGGYGLGQEVTYERRHLLARIHDLRAGLRAVKPLVPDEIEQSIDSIVAAINEAYDEATSRDALELDVVNKVRAMTNTIERVVAPVMSPIGPADEDLFDADFDEPEEAEVEEIDELDVPADAEQVDEAP